MALVKAELYFSKMIKIVVCFLFFSVSITAFAQEAADTAARNSKAAHEIYGDMSAALAFLAGGHGCSAAIRYYLQVHNERTRSLAGGSQAHYTPLAIHEQVY